MDLSNSNFRNSGKVSLVIPVLNEASNVGKLIEEIRALPKDYHTSRIREIVFVDDGSSDGTTDIIKTQMFKTDEINIVLKERKMKLGTVNAQLYGISLASNDTVLIMDGDLQHPTKYISRLISKFFEGYDMVIASRYVKNGSAKRKLVHGVVSRGANTLAKFMLPWTRYIKDPISGFFILNRRIVNIPQNIHDFNKLALYILSTNRKITVAEVPFGFVERRDGVSKVSTGGVDFMVKYVAELRYYRHLHIYNNPTTLSSEPTVEFSRP